jgi:hypothetical protein
MQRSRLIPEFSRLGSCDYRSRRGWRIILCNSGVATGHQSQQHRLPLHLLHTLHSRLPLVNHKPKTLVTTAT